MLYMTQAGNCAVFGLKGFKLQEKELVFWDKVLFQR